MKTVTIPEAEYQQMQQTISKPVSLKRGSGKKLITYMADDLTAPLDDFNEKK